MLEPGGLLLGSASSPVLSNLGRRDDGGLGWIVLRCPRIDPLPATCLPVPPSLPPCSPRLHWTELRLQVSVFGVLFCDVRVPRDPHAALSGEVGAVADGGRGQARGSDVLVELLGVGRHLHISRMVVVRAGEELQPACRRERKKVSLI